MSTTESTDLQSGDSSQSTRDKAQEVAGSAADQGRAVAGTAREEAAHVASEARDHVRALFSEATSQMDEQSRTQQQRLAGTARTFSDDLSEMAGDRSGFASDLAREVSDRARSLASQLEDREPRDLLQGLREFARERPGTFLLGAVAAGIVAGRLTRAARDATNESGEMASGSTTWADPTVASPIPPNTEPAMRDDLNEASRGDVSPRGVPPVDPGTRP